MNSSAALRARFLDFFKTRGHEIVPSSSLVPTNDPTLLFTNAGMVQFKEIFLGCETRSYARAASSQRCVRAGGKHNDLENVGYTARHHTFFEMLGNFSFGDYFKREAIRYAWEFLTREVGIPHERLWVTVYEDDDEAADVWLNDIKVDPKRFSRIGAKDNFWSMGDTGPCGPCTEIFYDHGPEIPGGPPGSANTEGDRYIEVWNLVFMQYDRDEHGDLAPLPNPAVDTGMGLERMAAILQGVHDNYQIDLFRRLIRATADLTGDENPSGPSYKVITDHIRSCSFLIADGVLPSNEGRGYVLRRIIRRAVRHGHKLGLNEPFFYKLVPALVDEMGRAYPELVKFQAQIERVLRNEEVRFAETLEQGMHILESDIAKLPGKIVPGETIFKLYDTYGFPVDLTADIARERGLTLDTEGFERHMDAQRSRARAASQFKAIDFGDSENSGVFKDTEFTGYDRLIDEGVINALL
ncbi:MAG TPA: alanine--tRNA ligase, partial [Gammaproteobacteria bacterium]|nr:alanine--tRNA ligase [Gammaproteobacteria bacterium]